MPVNIETAKLEDYRNMMLRPTKLNETAKVLYDLAQKASGSLIEIGTNKREVEALQVRMDSAENDISYLRDRVSALATNLDNLTNNVSTLSDAITRIGTSIDNLDERVSALENA